MGIKLTVMTLDIDPDSKPVTKVFQKDEITLGRLPSNDIVLNRPEVSGIHARLRLEREVDGEPSRLFITDLGSSNGTTVEKNHLRPRVEIGMMPNERIFIGNYVIKPSAIEDDALSVNEHYDDQVKQSEMVGAPDSFSEGERHAGTTGFKHPDMANLEGSFTKHADLLDEKPRLMAVNSGDLPTSEASWLKNPAGMSEAHRGNDTNFAARSSRANPSSSLIFSSDVRAEPGVRSPIKFQGMPDSSSDFSEPQKTAEFVSPFGKAPVFPEEETPEPKGRFHFSPSEQSINSPSDFESSDEFYDTEEAEFDSESERRQEEEEAAKARAEMAEAECRHMTSQPKTIPTEEHLSSNIAAKPEPAVSQPVNFHSSAVKTARSAGISISVKVDGSDVRSLNFVATAYTEILGRVQHRGNPLVGVVVDAGALGTAITQSDGSFSIPKVLEGTEYQLRFSKERFLLEPSDYSGRAVLGGSNVVVQATQLFSISGVITHSGQALSGVEVDGGELGKTITRDDGSYTFENVPEGREYNLTLYKEGYVFKN